GQDEGGDAGGEGGDRGEGPQAPREGRQGEAGRGLPAGRSLRHDGSSKQEREVDVERDYGPAVVGMQGRRAGGQRSRRWRIELPAYLAVVGFAQPPPSTKPSRLAA